MSIFKYLNVSSKLKAIGKWTGIVVGGFILFQILCHFHCLSMMQEKHMANDFDFGFTAVDEVPDVSDQPAAPSIDNQDKIINMLKELEVKILNAESSGNQEHRSLIESDVATKLRDVEDLVLPLLYNLQKDPEKEYIHWPNRTAIIDKQIERIKAVTRYYERI